MFPTGFEWDENKCLKNIEKHGYDFIDAELVFKNPIIKIKSDRKGEERYKVVGCISIKPNKKHVVTLAYTQRNTNKRIISFRVARPSEVEKYLKHIK